jgi:hypothetical protein
MDSQVVEEAGKSIACDQHTPVPAIPTSESVVWSPVGACPAEAMNQWNHSAASVY